MKGYKSPKIEVMTSPDCIATSEDVTTGGIVFPWTNPTAEADDTITVNENAISTSDAYDL